ncbi:CHAT domain-containing protein [Lunatibacter salilacus]|uniref:CHAT domain-containing protein n=1 Tax=Lunatibacter salilacus TaxID=2483804 RepID=UPI00131B7518|nr:CHAT domain-containing protein [Lunatibacter salilacus]
MFLNLKNSLTIFLCLFFVFTQAAPIPQKEILQTDLISLADSLETNQRYLESAGIFQKITDQLGEDHKDYAVYQSKYHHNLGLHFSGQQNYSQAHSEFENALKFSNQLLAAGNADYLKDVFTNTYHNIANTGDWENSLKKALEGYQLLETHLKARDKADFVYDIAYLYDKNREFHQAINVYKESIALYESLPEEELKVSSLALAYNNLGTMYAETGFFTQRKHCYLQAKSLWESDPKVDKSNLITIYGNLMRLYRTYGDKEGAGELIKGVNSHFDKWVAEASFGKTDFKVDEKPELMHYVNKHRINILYFDLTDDKASALAHLDSLRCYFQQLPRRHQIKYSNYLISSILNSAAILDDYEHETIKQQKTQLLDLALQESINTDNYYYEMLTYADYCKYWLFSSNNLDRALIYLDKALEIGRKHDIREVNLLNLSLKKADVLQQMGDFGQAESIVKHAFSLLLGEEVENVMVVDEHDFRERNSVFYINAVKEAANIYRNQYALTGDRNLGLIGYHLYDVAAIIFQDYYQKGAYNPSLSMTAGNIHEGLIALHIQLEKTHVDSLLARVENNTSQLLWREFESKFQQFLPVPDSLLLNHNLLRTSLAQIPKDSISLNDERRKLESDLAANEASITSHDANYFGFFSGGLDIDNLQSQLSGSRAIVRYMATDKKLFAFVVTSSEIRVVDLGEKKPVFDLLESYHEQIQRIQPNAAGMSKELFSLLIHPLHLEPEVISKLVIIPNAKLNYLAFESLENPENSRLLVEDYAISYSNSFKLWVLQQNIDTNWHNRHSVAVFVPEYPQSYLTNFEENHVTRGRLTHLEGALSEGQYIVNLLGGELFQKEKANKSQFLQAVGAYQVYHFATHAVVDQTDYESSGIYFQDGEIMSYSELYNMQFPAELVVLSACNTGIGKLQAGEGLMSLSRALTYAGVKASVYSLWQVPDEETGVLMRNFYTYLEQGSNKEEALTMAKQKFLADFPMKRHPFYWAGFVLNGNIDELPPDRTAFLVREYGIYLGFGLLILGIAIFLYLKRRPPIF